MGEIADGILNGDFDEQTGEYLGEGMGFPRTAEKGFYNSIRKKRKPRRNIEHAMKGESLGGLHLVGKTIYVSGIGDCKLLDYGGKRGKKRYTVEDSGGLQFKVKFSRFVFNKR